MTPLVSVVVCTYNREDLITGCLDSLADQTADPSSFEVLVIDNNSTDNTNHLVRNYLRLSNMRLISEPMQGLSHARNRGLREAKGDYVAYLDDDARAEPHYIENILKLLDQFSDSVDCYGGPILPFYTTEKPAWFKDEYEIRRLRTEAGFEEKGKTFSGSNMIWKKTLIEQLGRFNTEVGIRGDLLILGEETLLFDKLWDNRGARLYYSPELIVYHWVPDIKLKVRYQLKRNLATGLFYASRIDSQSLLFFVHYFFKNIFTVITRAFLSLFKIPFYKKWQNWVVEQLAPIMIPLGKSIWLLGFRPHLYR